MSKIEALNFKGISRKAGNRPTSARSARTFEEDKQNKKRNEKNKRHVKSDSRSGSSSSDSDDEDEWIEKVDEAKSVEEAMRVLWENDPETFYIYGERILRMVSYKLERGWTLSDDEN